MASSSTTMLILGAVGVGALVMLSGNKASASTTTTRSTGNASKLTTKQLAQRLADSVTAKQYDYPRQWAREFQSAAGIAVDGIYGPATAAAVTKYIGTAPKALFVAKKAATTPNAVRG